MCSLCQTVGVANVLISEIPIECLPVVEPNVMRNMPLSPREKQFLRRVAAGKTDAQIAETLGGNAKQVSE